MKRSEYLENWELRHVGQIVQLWSNVGGAELRQVDQLVGLSDPVLRRLGPRRQRGHQVHCRVLRFPVCCWIGVETIQHGLHIPGTMYQCVII